MSEGTHTHTHKGLCCTSLGVEKREAARREQYRRKSDDIFMKAIRVGVHKKARNTISILWVELPSIT